MDSKLILFGILVFVAVGLLVAGIYQSWHSTKGPQAERMARRLRDVIGDERGKRVDSITKERLLSQDPLLQRVLLRTPGVASLDQLLLQSGRRWSAARLVGTMLAAFFCTVIAAAVLGLPWFAWPVAGVIVGALPVMEVNRAKSKRLLKIESQLPDALDLMGRAMRAGHAFPTALKMVGDEMPMPLAGEFRAVFDEVNFGVAMPNALMNLAVRVPSTDLRYVVVAVLIQRETGGNLTELLTSISAIIRDRLKLLGQVRILSAEGRMSAWVLGLLPFGVSGVMFISNPSFLMVLFTDPGGRKMLYAAGFMMLIGVFAIRKVTHIRV
jgi:tight adherence protein B